MNKNIGKIDKIVRIIVGVAIIAYGFMTNSWLGVIGLIPLGTALIGWCPLYCPLKINTTCDKDNSKKD
ncbi:YgaP family membrane protein [Arcobacter sp.]|uniref:YgaP family membrane protein n=1 Tax=unclassified Arcobacter TaxID=2593671 RepID=UPI003AFFD466